MYALDKEYKSVGTVSSLPQLRCYHASTVRVPYICSFSELSSRLPIQRTHSRQYMYLPQQTQLCPTRLGFFFSLPHFWLLAYQLQAFKAVIS